MGSSLSSAPGALPGYPTAAEALDSAECVFLIALRWWVAEVKQGIDPLPRLHQGLSAAGAPDAAYSMDQFMRVIARTARRPIDVGCPRCPHLTHDEQRLLHAASLAQAGETARVEEVLRTSMLSPSGAEFALGPLEGLGELFAGVDLIFRLRSLSDDHDPIGGDVQAWMPPLSATLH